MDVRAARTARGGHCLPAAECDECAQAAAEFPAGWATALSDRLCPVRRHSADRRRFERARIKAVFKGLPVDTINPFLLAAGLAKAMLM